MTDEINDSSDKAIVPWDRKVVEDNEVYLTQTACLWSFKFETKDISYRGMATALEVSLPSIVKDLRQGKSEGTIGEDDSINKWSWNVQAV